MLHCTETEEHVLSLMMVKPVCFESARTRLRPTDFFDPFHRWCFETMIDHGDPATAGAELLYAVKSDSERFRVGRFLGTERGYLPGYLPSYVARLIDYSRKRATLELVDLASDTERGTPEVLKEIRSRVTEIESRGTASTTGVMIGDTIAGTVEEITSGNTKVCATTGLSGVDRMLDGGFRSGESAVLAASTGGGKTCFALNVAAHNAGRGKSVAIFSMEMQHDELESRLLASMAKVDLGHITRREINSTDRKRLVEAQNELANMRIAIFDDAGQTMKRIRNLTASVKDDHGLDLVIIDYMQLIRADNERASLREQVTQVSRDLKILAREFDCSVMTLSQLSRAASKEERPTVHHLKESGSIENDADICLMIYPDGDGKNMAVEVAKNRRGRIGCRVVEWNRHLQSFSDRDPLDNPFNDAL